MMLSRLVLPTRRPLMRSNSTTIRPRLPVPRLRSTLDKYLTSLQPFLLEDEARGGPPYSSAYALRVKWAGDFENGIGSVCQERLLALDRKSANNWLDDNIWMKRAYLEWRAPLLINSNWWLAFQHDEGVQGWNATIGRSGVTTGQIRRAAWLVWRTLEFKDKLARSSQEHYPGTTRTGIWLRECTAKMFNVCRIPQPSCDVLSLPPLPSSPNARKILVMVHDWFYAVEVCDSYLNRIPVVEIERRLKAVVNDVEAKIGRWEKAVPVGVLSADERDVWAENLQHLLDISPQNHKTLDTIHESLFALSLDHINYTIPSSFPPPSALTDSSLDAHLRNIRSSSTAHNRFFDKSYTIIIEPNTRAGAMGEHSPCEALVPSIVAEYALVEAVDDTAFTTGLQEDAGDGVGWDRLEWVTDDKIAMECVYAERKAKEVIDDSDDSGLWFMEYGGDWIKNVAKQSPDAYIQMALQLAWFWTRGSFTATYETALTRMFDKGRTETIRTFTRDSRAWVLSMVDTSTAKERYAFLLRALQTHTKLTREAATGRGIDRHLLGLKMMLKEGEDGGDFFGDEMFGRSQRWELSTSGLSAGYLFRGTGFGAAYEDGYGINYLAGPDIVKFGIECKLSSPHTSTEMFKGAVVRAMRDMKAVCEEGMIEQEIVSRL